MDSSGNKVGDPETYLHRIGRTGRFGSKGIAITLHDRPEDQRYLNEITNHFAMQGVVKPLKDHEHLKSLLDEIRQI
jgi:ATP-dependent RNA helicase DDX19/DBP5